MTATSSARRFLLHAVPALLGAAVACGAAPGCYSAGAGTSPPPKGFYYPVGLAVSGDGKYLYAANSDFDLQWNGGTLQSYDLAQIRTDTAQLIRANNPLTGVTADTSAIPFLGGRGPACVVSGPSIPLEETCAPPVDSSRYVRWNATIGAFATDLQIGLGGQRLFVPVRGDATLTWADLDTTNGHFNCGAGADGRCGADHQAGSVRDPGNSRQVSMPGEPFGMAQTEDGTAIAITHQTDTKTTLFRTRGTDPLASPSVQFVLDGLPLGGDGIVAVPHDDIAVTRCEKVSNKPPCVRPAFLQTSRNVAEVDLLRYYDDDGSTLSRPFIAREVAYGLSTNSGGFDSRGIAIDTTPRAACRARLPAGTALGASPPDPGDVACGQVPARVFIANRSPPSLVVGEIGGPSGSGDGTYDPDRLVLTGNVPLAEGPSRVYVAPIVDAAGGGALSVRVFIVCFDSSTVFVYDPDAQAVENVIYVGPGPFAMAFDPFTTDAMAIHAADGVTDTALGLRPYRFAYVASFRDSFVQVIDLDATSPRTFEHVVFTLGQPTPPKGS